jgi:hypothetical protein
MTQHYPLLPDYVGIDREIDYGSYPANSAIGMLHRNEPGIQITAESQVVFGPGDLVAPALQVTGAVRVLGQYGKITAIGSLNNCTDVHTDLWDDVADNPKKLTRGNPGGADLSGVPVGTFLFDGEDSIVLPADESRFFEADTRTEGKPFTINAHPTGNTYLRILMSTTDAPMDVTFLFYFHYIPLVPGSTLTTFL